ncbi:unnamed protein product [Chrysoparadoxa australica]
MGKVLKDLIAQAVADKTLWTKNWAAEAIPRLSSREKEENGALGQWNERKKGKKKKRRRNEDPPSRGQDEGPSPLKGKGFSMDEAARADRMKRFECSSGSVTPSYSSRAGVYRDSSGKSSRPHAFELDENGEIDWDSLTIKGNCTKLRKEYFRLTSAPNPDTVRPKPILEQALAALELDWQRREHDYVWMCSQMKAIRQDATVQRIKDDFTVKVYETHARMALQERDLNEYNQCQTQLKELYRIGLKGNEQEFTAYRILYYLYMATNQKYQEGSKDMLRILKSLSKEAWKDSAVTHALRVREALACFNYHQLFRLHKTAPNLGGLVMEPLMDTLRVKALQRIVKAYKPSLPTAFALSELELPVDSSGIDFLVRVGCAITAGGKEIDCKSSSISASGLATDKPNSLL